MSTFPYRSALIVGAGPGISASVARQLAAAGVTVGLAARDVQKLSDLARETNSHVFEVDASDAASVARLFDEADDAIGDIDVVLYNASGRTKGAIADLDTSDVEKAIAVSALGAFYVCQQAARRMLPRRSGAILFTGATASVKGFAMSSAFAMGKFALRGLAQSAARELAPEGIHVVHFLLDGAVRSVGYPDPADKPDSTLDPDAVAQVYLDALRQARSAWSWEVEVRPWVEKF